MVVTVVSEEISGEDGFSAFAGVVSAGAGVEAPDADAVVDWPCAVYALP